jgi:UPF0042 nucleotide-binding protein
MINDMSQSTKTNEMKLIIVSGLSGSGKTIALHTLEDAGYFCVDNLPISLLPNFIDTMLEAKPATYDFVAVAIDARSGADDINYFDEIIKQAREQADFVEILFLTSDIKKLITRFSETRRKHPLSRQGIPLIDAIKLEQNLLRNIYSKADLVIDTSKFNVHQLRQMIIKRLIPSNSSELAIMVQSFGFKHGLPTDTDFVFDVRCLPNPHWESHLKDFSGRDAPIVDYLESFPEVISMFDSINSFLTTWIPCFEKENRSYMTISLGCTGGQHRSVFLADKLALSLKNKKYNSTVRHRELS